MLVLGQKLKSVCDYLNSLEEGNPAARVSVTALHQICDRTDENRVGSFRKHRWGVGFVPLEEAGRAFEGERQKGYEKALIVGSPECYAVS